MILKQLPQPSPDHVRCGKCGGTGFFCLGTNNGKPYSNTGFACYPCTGAGWIYNPPRTTAPKLPAEPVQPLSLPFKSKADAKRQLQHLIDTSDRAVYRCILAIYKLQTEAEKNADTTVEDNGVGFSGNDAELMSSFAKQLQQGRTLSPKQMPFARKKARKYWNQLRQIITGEIKVPA